MAFMDDELSAARTETMTLPLLPMLLVNGVALTISDEIPEGLKAFTFDVYEQYGVAQVMTSRATNVPLIGDSTRENLVRVFAVKAAFDADEDQARLSNRTGRNIFTNKLVQARDTIDQKLDLIGFSGESGTSLLGMSNYPGISIEVVPNDGIDTTNANAATRRWSFKTSEQVLRDLNQIATSVNKQTAGAVSSNRLLVGHDVALYLQNRVFNRDTGESILKIFLQNQAVLANGIREVVGHPAMDNAGVGGSSRIVAYTTTSRYNKFHIPQGGGFRDTGLDKKGDVYMVECKANTAGVEIQRIKEIAYADITL